jgi:2,3-bisphosphoglycerate-independent phosphoglycerate mutase
MKAICKSVKSKGYLKTLTYKYKEYKMTLVINQNKKASTINEQDRMKEQGDFALVRKLNKRTDKLLKKAITSLVLKLRMACAIRNVDEVDTEISIVLKRKNGERETVNKADLLNSLSEDILSKELLSVLDYCFQRITLAELEEKLNEQ